MRGSACLQIAGGLALGSLAALLLGREQHTTDAAQMAAEIPKLVPGPSARRLSDVPLSAAARRHATPSSRWADVRDVTGSAAAYTQARETSDARDSQPGLAVAAGSALPDFPSHDVDLSNVPEEDAPEPVPLLPAIEEAFASVTEPLLRQRLDRHRQLQDELRDEWSRSTERALREFIAKQPENPQVESLVACRVSQCELQLRDVGGPAAGTRAAPSSALSIRLRMKFPNMRGVAMAGMAGDAPFTLVFLDRPPSP